MKFYRIELHDGPVETVEARDMDEAARKVRNQRGYTGQLVDGGTEYIFRDVIRAKRESLNLTPADVADQIGASWIGASVARVEDGSWKLSTDDKRWYMQLLDNMERGVGV